MKRKILNLYIILTGSFIVSVNASYCQDTTVYLTAIDSSLYSVGGFRSFGQIYLYHNATPKDTRYFNSNKGLLNQLPDKKNYDKYFQFARTLWDLKKTVEAKKLFANIFNSNKPFYSANYYHSSDIPGDTSTNIYGYGSFTSNYKNYAAIYLTKICIEQKEFDSALFYLNTAVNTYPVSYSCGTGAMMQEQEYTTLYSLCYRGLNKNRDIIDLLLPKCNYWNDDILINALKNTYSKEDIQTYLIAAENSIVCLLNTEPSYSYRTTYSKKKEKTDTIIYYSGSATTKLFGKEVVLPVPDLENGEHLTKDRFIREFKESYFYTQLKGDG